MHDKVLRMFKKIGFIIREDKFRIGYLHFTTFVTNIVILLDNNFFYLSRCQMADERILGKYCLAIVQYHYKNNTVLSYFITL